MTIVGVVALIQSKKVGFRDLWSVWNIYTTVALIVFLCAAAGLVAISVFGPLLVSRGLLLTVTGASLFLFIGSIFHPLEAMYLSGTVETVHFGQGSPVSISKQ